MLNNDRLTKEMEELLNTFGKGSLNMIGIGPTAAAMTTSLRIRLGEGEF